MDALLNTVKLTDGVSFHNVIDKRFKTNRISINLITDLKKENVTANAIIPFLLKKGYAGCEDFTAFNRKLQNLYGAYVSAYIQKVGDYQIMSLSITGIDDRFALENEKITTEISDILCNMLLHPILENGDFLEKEVALEKTALIDTIEAEINEKRIYAINSLVKFMCSDEPFGIPKYGYKEEVLKLTPNLIKQAYDSLLEKSRIDIMYVGCGNQDHAKAVFAKAFTSIKRKYSELGEIKTHNTCEIVKEKTENMAVSQSKMVLGFCGENSTKNVIATKLMVAVLGGTPSSKLFVNVREKLSLCYYCAARYDRFKAIMMIDCGVESKNIIKARAEILAQLDCIKNGDVTDEEMRNASLSLQNALRSVYDSDGAMESWYMGQILGKTLISPLEEAERLNKVGKQEVIDAAKCITLDSVYVLTGNEVE